MDDGCSILCKQLNIEDYPFIIRFKTQRMEIYFKDDMSEDIEDYPFIIRFKTVL